MPAVQQLGLRGTFVQYLTKHLFGTLDLACVAHTVQKIHLTIVLPLCLVASIPRQKLGSCSSCFHKQVIWSCHGLVIGQVMEEDETVLEAG